MSILAGRVFYFGIEKIHPPPILTKFVKFGQNFANFFLRLAHRIVTQRTRWAACPSPLCKSVRCPNPVVKKSLHFGGPQDFQNSVLKVTHDEPRNCALYAEAVVNTPQRSCSEQTISTIQFQVISSLTPGVSCTS